MPSPENINAGYSPFLTGLVQSFIPDYADYIGSLLLPRIPVGSKIGQYNVWTQGDFLRRGGKPLSNYEAAPIEGFTLSKQQFNMSTWGVATNWTQQDLQDAAVTGITPESYERAKTDFVIGKAIIEREIAVATLFQTSANWSTTYAGVASAPNGSQFIAWDQAAAVPVDDVEKIKETNRLAGNRKVNTLVLPQAIWSKMKSNASLIDRIKYGGTMDRPTEVTLDQIKALFEIQNIWVPSAVYNTAAEGAAESYADIWAKTIWLGYLEPTPNIERPSAAYNFTWRGGAAQGVQTAGPGPQAFDAVEDSQGFFIRRYRENRPNAEFVECEKYEAPNVTAPSLGITMTAAAS